jgi:hypothetical protein
MIAGNMIGALNGTEQVVFDFENGDQYTKLLMHNDGGLTDVATGKTVTVVGSVTSSATQKKFGSASAYFPGSASYLTLADSADWNFGSGDFTIDLWCRWNSLSHTMFFAQGTNIGGPFDYIYFFYDVSGHNINFTAYPGNVKAAEYVTSTWNPTINTWYHIALVRSGANVYIFIDGVAQSLTVNQAIGSNATGDYASLLAIGNLMPTHTSYDDSDIYLDEYRISKGIARWTSNFTPPTSAYVCEPLSSISTGNILNGNEDGWYTVLFRQIGADSANYAYFKLNNDTSSIYGCRGITAGVPGGVGTTVADYSYTAAAPMRMTINATTAPGESLFTVLRLYAKSGSVRLCNMVAAEKISGTTVSELSTVGFVYNNTVDNIVSMQAYPHTGNGFGVGTRMIVIKHNMFTNGTPTGTITSSTAPKGAWTRVGRVKLASAASSVTFSGLDGDRDVVYYLSRAGKFATAAGSGPAIRFNGDSTATYGRQTLEASSTTVGARRETSNTQMFGSTAGDALNNYFQDNFFIFAKSGFVRPAVSTSSMDITGTTVTWIETDGGVWNNTSSNITSMSMLIGADTYAAGSTFTLYALRPAG